MCAYLNGIEAKILSQNRWLAFRYFQLYPVTAGQTVGLDAAPATTKRSLGTFQAAIMAGNCRRRERFRPLLGGSGVCTAGHLLVL